MTIYDQASRRSIKRYAVCGKCGSRQFLLNKDQVALSNWSFSCANCGTKNPDPWVEKCDETLSRIAATIGPGGNIVGEASMEKINYAASSAYFVKSDTFITFPEGSGIEALEPGQAYLLAGVVERLVGLEGPPLSDADVSDQLLAKDRAEEATEFGEVLQGIKLAEDTNNAAVADLMKKVKAERLASWQQAGWLQRNAALPADILPRLQQRHEWAGKYDPFRLLVEHAALTRTKLRGEIVGGRATYVDFTNPDEWLVQPESPQRTTLIATAQEALRYLGIARAGLISKFDLCKFSFGYSRVGDTPRILKHGRMMPVRLDLFPKVQVGHESRHRPRTIERSFLFQTG
jgi:hypothetical protein